MKSRQLARLLPPGRRENPFPATEALLWHSRLQRTRVEPIRKPWMAPVHPSGAPQGAEGLIACFSKPRQLLVPGAEVAQAGCSAQPCSHASCWSQLPSRCSGVIFGKWAVSAPQHQERGTLRWAPPLPVPGQGRALLLCQQQCCHCLIPATSELLAQPVPPATGASDASVMPSPAWHWVSWEFQSVLEGCEEELHVQASLQPGR